MYYKHQPIWPFLAKFTPKISPLTWRLDSVCDVWVIVGVGYIYVCRHYLSRHDVFHGTTIIL